jgi:N-acetylglucosamine-6-phosphate deacetylase
MESEVLRGRVVTGAELFADGYVTIVGDHIEEVGPASAYPGRLPEPTGTLLPGLVDIHCHGGGGATVTSGEVAQVEAVARHHQDAGTTSMLASMVTDRPDRLLAAVGAAAVAAERGAVAGIHLEGPFLAPGRCGAQDPRHLRLPDLDLARELIAAGAGHVRVMTLAPELEGADRLMDLLDELDVLPAVGHTDGDAATVARALARTRRGLVTHLFNAMPPLHHRAPGPVGASLDTAARGEARVELVADGVHLADATVRMVFDLLGPDRVVLVTDATAAAGMPDGDYRLGPLPVTVAGGVARLQGSDDQPVAGGTMRLLEVVRRCVRDAGVDLLAAVRAAAVTPASVIGLGHRAGTLAPGLRADLLVVDDRLGLRRVMCGGRWVGPS